MRSNNQELVHSFAPLARGDATRLILGSMPGKASLSAQQYYAHPRNAFWQLIEQVLAIPATLPYAQRCAALLARQIAVWDVLQTCTRTSSLDADIDPASIVPNDFAGFFTAHPNISKIYCNGTAAEQLFRRHVLSTLPASLPQFELLRLPSTSPANASVSYANKARLWQQLNCSSEPEPGTLRVPATGSVP